MAAVTALALLSGLAGCASLAPAGSTSASASAGAAPQPYAVLNGMALQPQLEARILALDAERVSDAEVRTVLAVAPAPRIVTLHGGIYPVHLLMESFSRFLAGMGYPQAKLRHPGDGRRSHSPYESSTQIAGLIAWYYENEAMMPMMVGHSQGGIQLVKVLHDLAGSAPIAVWHPKTDAALPRTSIVDPYSGAQRPVAGLRIGYASVVGAGGAALLLPNQWNMVKRLHTIPDSVADFTGFAIGLDLVAWDLPGAGAVYKANGAARVRNVELPIGYSHVFVAATSPLARDPVMRDWLNAYVPGGDTALPADAQSTDNSLWAADVWYSIKKHWVLQAQQLVRVRQELAAAGKLTPPPHPPIQAEGARQPYDGPEDTPASSQRPRPGEAPPANRVAPGPQPQPAH